MPAARRRKLILAAAEEVFARSGYHGASLDGIAQAAGVSKALIYEHFDSKRDLHESLLQERVAEIFRRLQANADSGATGEDRLRGGVDAFLSFVEEHRVAWRALFRDAADPAVADLIERVQAQATAVIATLMAAAPGAAGDARAREAIELHAQLLSGAVQALANWWHSHPEVPRSVLVDRVVEFAWVGLRAHSAGVDGAGLQNGAGAKPPPTRQPRAQAARQRPPDSGPSSTGSRSAPR
jgi:AcrR family transcriptional regulator